MMSKRLLGFLIPAFIASLIYAYLQMPRQERVSTGDDKITQRPQTKKQQQGQKSAVLGGEGGYPRLRSDLLERKSQPYPGVHRNLFSAAFTSGPGEDVEVLPEEILEVIAPPVVIAVPPPQPPPTPQEIVRQELALYKFVGFFKKGEKTTIFLTTNGEVFLVRKGDYLGRDRKYYVVNITDTNMELRKDGAGDFLIKLTDQEFLAAVPLSTSPAGASFTPGTITQEQESYLSNQPESLTRPDEELPTEDQLQPEEDN
jgi:hypothetical protein